MKIKLRRLKILENIVSDSPILEHEIKTIDRPLPGTGFISYVYVNGESVAMIEYFPMVHKGRTVMYLNYIKVDYIMRRKNLATMLVKEVERKTKEENIDVIILRPAIGMDNFWKNQGFVYDKEMYKGADMRKELKK